MLLIHGGSNPEGDSRWHFWAKIFNFPIYGSYQGIFFIHTILVRAPKATAQDLWAFDATSDSWARRVTAEAPAALSVG